MNKNYGFCHQPTEPDHWWMGSEKATERFGARKPMPGGHGWGKYKPEKEYQNRFDLETMACTVFGALNAWETLANFYGYKDFPKNCSERYNAILAGITQNGGRPHDSAETIRLFGVLENDLLPWTEDMNMWDKFYSPKPMDENLIKRAQEITSKYICGHEWVFNGLFGANNKQDKLKAALERTTVCVSVDPSMQGENGLYFKLEGGKDVHWAQLLDYREGEWWEIYDTYDDVKKRFVWDYDFDSAQMYFLTRKGEVDGVLKKAMQELLDLLKRALYKLKQRNA